VASNYFIVYLKLNPTTNIILFHHIGFHFDFLSIVDILLELWLENAFTNLGKIS
jgi:hypothetical protein